MGTDETRKIRARVRSDGRVQIALPGGSWFGLTDGRWYRATVAHYCRCRAEGHVTGLADNDLDWSSTFAFGRVGEVYFDDRPDRYLNAFLRTLNLTPRGT